MKETTANERFQIQPGEIGFLTYLLTYLFLTSCDITKTGYADTNPLLAKIILEVERKMLYRMVSLFGLSIS